jgi:pSer/pThr/pTyr-binding forkhead associated (FHA) protein
VPDGAEKVEEQLSESDRVKTRTSTIQDAGSTGGVVVAWLTVTVPGAEALRVPITNLQTRLVIGRDARADIPINNQVVSRLHAIVSHDRAKFFIEDLHSKNGTVLNGRYVPSKPTRLSSGDEIRIGQILIVFQTYSPDQIATLAPQAHKQDTVTPRTVIPTGYGALDSLLGGGVPCGYAVVLLSHSCDERDILVARIIESSVRAGRPTFFISDDLSQFAGFSRDFFAFSSRASRRPEGDHLSPVPIPTIENISELNISISQGLTEAKVDQNKEKLMVVEILPDILLHHKSIVTRRWLSDFVAKRKSQNFTLLFTLNPSIASESEVTAVVDLFDGVIRIREVDTKAGSQTFLGIKRMFATRYESKKACETIGATTAYGVFVNGASLTLLPH